MRPFLSYSLIILLLAACSHGRTKSVGTGETMPQDMLIEKRERWQHADARIHPGAWAPHILLPSLYAGEDVPSFTQREHIVLFWASWCEDCRREMPDIIQFQRDHPDIPWVTISLDNMAGEAQAYVWEQKLQGTHLFDGRAWEGTACSDYAVPLHGIPYLILIGADGRIKHVAGDIRTIKAHL
ncbi:MAG: TlpA family protein disulfide reductase [Bacteroidaceae bacterium]|nr:TlpA family protein disulfide reductase [Bacteroidaceae bacterium]